MKNKKTLKPVFATWKRKKRRKKYQGNVKSFMKMLIIFPIILGFVFFFCSKEKYEDKKLIDSNKQEDKIIVELQNNLTKAKYKSAMQDMECLGLALEDYVLDYGFAPNDLSDTFNEVISLMDKKYSSVGYLIVPAYLTKEMFSPIDPWGNPYMLKTEKDKFWIVCGGSNGKFHSKIIKDKNYIGYKKVGTYTQVNGQEIIYHSHVKIPYKSEERKGETYTASGFLYYPIFKKKHEKIAKEKEIEQKYIEYEKIRNARISTLLKAEVPRIKKKVEPIYPSVALKSQVLGEVVLEVKIDIHGKVILAKIISGHPLLREAAINAVKQWVFEPKIINGVLKTKNFAIKIAFK